MSPSFSLSCTRLLCQLSRAADMVPKAKSSTPHHQRPALGRASNVFIRCQNLGGRGTGLRAAGPDPAMTINYHAHNAVVQFKGIFAR